MSEMNLNDSPEELLEHYLVVINQHDFDLVQPLISIDAVFWFNDGSHSGLAAIRTAFESTWAGFPLERYWLEDVVWIARGDSTATCVYRFCWSTVRNGNTFSGGGRGTNVFIYEGGQWLIAHEHLSQHPAPPVS